MTNLDELGHPEPPLAGGEIDTLLGSLERQRATFAWKCGGLDAAGLRVTVVASTDETTNAVLPGNSGASSDTKAAGTAALPHGVTSGCNPRACRLTQS